ncbi:hypothetical protein BDN70DRAFT_16622 [Pholiota conissans]|uniref:Transmembrane protein n=1 Tax=Pholiota conissans TaxID=109636 RepID=A0A9P5ZG44_9AGAR|nr:hypothetical protein BDN70DRAFT_16622 [Pholiota conissans]
MMTFLVSFSQHMPSLTRMFDSHHHYPMAFVRFYPLSTYFVLGAAHGLLASFSKAHDSSSPFFSFSSFDFYPFVYFVLFSFLMQDFRSFVHLMTLHDQQISNHKLYSTVTTSYPLITYGFRNHHHHGSSSNLCYAFVFGRFIFIVVVVLRFFEFSL